MAGIDICIFLSFMLNLSVAMAAIGNFALFSSLLVWLALAAQPAGGSMQQATPDPAEVAISAPLPGEALQGLVTVTGAAQVEGFQAAEVSFAYQTDATNTWFIIQQSTVSLPEGDLTQWDTTTISDGTYRLRLQVFRADGQVLETVVEGLRVRNYMPVETSTPQAAVAATTGVRPTSTPAPLPEFQPQAPAVITQPTNPAQLTASDLTVSMLGGAGFVLSGLLLAGLYLFMKSIFRR